MHEKTKRMIDSEKKANNNRKILAGIPPETITKLRYTEKYKCCMGDPREIIDMELKNGEEQIVDYIVGEMEKYKITFSEGCVMLGYITKLLKINDIYRGGIDIEEFYINECLRKELINLSKEIADYIQNQDEVHVNIPSTFDFVYSTLRFRTDNINLW
ncbi:hypothetical protein [Clostridium baratii]|uniref:hypothetical protein n=1 Tax=Clostridium baratii TaxID=1561 RepID=UPI0030D0E0EA